MSKSFSESSEKTTFDDEKYEHTEGRTLHVYYDGFTCRSVRILDSDNETLLYEVDLKCRRPNMTFRRGGSADGVVGTIKFNPWTRVINADINGNDDHTIIVKSKNWKCSTLPYTSPAFEGRTLSWNRRTPFLIMDHLLMDEHDNPIAKLSPKNKCFVKAATIELADSSLRQDQVDEVVMTGMAVLQNTIYYSTLNVTAVV